VAEKGPNAYGLYDMLGNAAEWVADDASGSKNRIVKGGSVAENSRLVRASARPTASPTSSDVNRGFRCVAVENLTERVLQTVAIPDPDLVSGSLTAGLGQGQHVAAQSNSPRRSGTRMRCGAPASKAACFFAPWSAAPETWPRPKW